jgi:hypothetical protein
MKTSDLPTRVVEQIVTRSIAGSFHTIGGRAAGSILLMSRE